MVDAAQAPEVIKKLVTSNSFVEAQWVDGLDAQGREYGKYVTEDVVGFWSDSFRFGDDTDAVDQDRSTALAWILSNIPSTGDIRIVSAS